jgi:hypothetical protein
MLAAYSVYTDAAWLDAARYTKVLQVRKVVQAKDGGYKGPRLYLSQAPECIVRHLAGEETWGLVCAYQGRALFLGIDCDSNWPTRWAILREVLTELGMHRAAFVTTGTTDDKGKVIITLSKPMPQSQAIALRDKILHRCNEYDAFGGIHPRDRIDKFPLNGEGGVLRVGGYWKGQYNRLLTLDGDPLDFTDLQPLKFKPEPMGIPPRSEPGEHTRKLLERPWTWADGRKAIQTNLVAMAAEARRITSSEDAGLSQFETWVKKVHEDSPDLSRPSPSGDARSPLDWHRNCLPAWNVSGQLGRDWTPKEFAVKPTRSGQAMKYIEITPQVGQYRDSRSPEGHYTVQNATYSRGQVDIYRLLVDWCDQYGIPRLSFSKDLESIAKAQGKSAGQVRKMLDDCERRGLLIKIKPPDKTGPRNTWQATTYALIGAGETRESVLWRLGLTEADIALRYEIAAARKSGKLVDLHPTKASR